MPGRGTFTSKGLFSLRSEPLFSISDMGVDRVDFVPVVQLIAVLSLNLLSRCRWQYLKKKQNISVEMYQFDSLLVVVGEPEKLPIID